VRLVGDCWITCTKSLAPPCSNNERPAYHSPWSSSSISNVGVLLCHWQPLEIRLSRHRVAETCQGSSIIHPRHKVRVNFLLEKNEYNHRIYGLNTRLFLLHIEHMQTRHILYHYSLEQPNNTSEQIILLE